MKTPLSSKRNCKECRKKFVPYRPIQIFCSFKCRWTEQNRRQSEYRHRYWIEKRARESRKWRKVLKCEVCSRRFRRNRPRQVQCSLACTKKKWKMANWDRVLAQARKDAHRKVLKSVVPKPCKVCGKDFTGKVFSHKRQKYCSDECRSKGVRKNMKAKYREILRNPSSNPEMYFKLKLRERVQNANSKAKARGCVEGECRKHHIHLHEWVLLKKKSGNRCAICGEKESMENVLTIDHVIPLSKGGHNVISNVQPLCRSCNSRKGNRIHLTGKVRQDRGTAE